MHSKIIFPAFLLIAYVFCSIMPSEAQEQQTLPKIPRVFIGMKRTAFVRIYPKSKARTYRQNAAEEWLTFDYPLTTKNQNVITFHIENNTIKDWQMNNRAEVVTEYLGEFSSLAFKTSFPAIDSAIQDVLQRIPYSDFLKITDRRRPVLFTEVFDSGTAQFANSSEIIALADDAPAFQDGLTIIKLSTGLNSAANEQAIKGVIAHELAHRVLEHVKHGKRTCAAEREANALIKQVMYTQLCKFVY
jgi:hypothetical protein